MDPPGDHADVELTSLIDETLRDHDDDGVVHGRGGSRRALSNGLRPSASRPPPPRLGTHDGRRGLPRPALLGIALAACALVALLLAARTEADLDAEDATSTTRGAAHDAGKRGRGDDDGVLLGFHDASPENVYGANRYRKPPGAGYAGRPRGGLHPVYVLVGRAGKDRDGGAAMGEGVDGVDDPDRFVDDPSHSPYADPRLPLSDAARDAEQREWEAKRDDVRSAYGAWDFQDDWPARHGGKPRPVVDWPSVKATLGEVDADAFPPGAWQADAAYVADLVTSGRRLVAAVRRAVGDEYGFDAAGPAGGVDVPDGDPPTTGSKAGWLYDDALQALARKLLRAMLTNAHFYVTLGGHSAAAGHGNNFFQSYMMGEWRSCAGVTPEQARRL